MSETVTAISTAPGEGGIGIVRVSGPESLNIMKRVMADAPENIRARHAYFGRVVADNRDPEADVIDEALFIYMKGPASYTGEDMLEIQGHGSNVSLRAILRAVLGTGLPGVRMAEKGEFTKTAFLNGKMDLAQAEAVIDIIKAKTDITLGIAERQIEGRLSRSITGIREDILNILAEMAVNIDYPDEDEENIGTGSLDMLAGRLDDARARVSELIATAGIGRIAREGIRAVIAGKPNAGKSSLMNAILGVGRVIVTDIPGTTRDTVEETAEIAGFPVVLVDTAGLRETDDKVEKIGIERTEKALNEADIIMLVLDGSRELDAEDESVIGYLEGLEERRILVVINKEDLGTSMSEDEVRTRLPGASIIRTSLVGASADEAAGKVSDTIGEMLELGSINARETSIITNERHLRMLKDAERDLAEASGMLRRGEPLEVAELSAHYAYDSLGRIIGEDAGDEVLDTVFSKFCLGK